MTKVLFIARARTKGVPQEVLAAKMSQILIPRKCKSSLMVVSLPLQSRKILAVMLMETLQKRMNIKSTAAALEAAWVTGFNEKTIRGYRKEFFENHGTFRDESRGKYKRLCLFNEQPCGFERMW